MNLIPVSLEVNPKDWNIETKRLCHKSYKLKEHCPEYTARLTLSSFLPETFLVMMIVAGVEFLLKESNEFKWNVWMNTFKVLSVCDGLRDLVTFVQFKNREKHPWSSVTFSKVAGF